MSAMTTENSRLAIAGLRCNHILLSSKQFGTKNEAIKMEKECVDTLVVVV